MRWIAWAWIVGPTSFSTSRRTGVFGSEARPMPIKPPIEVPTQSTLSAFNRASKVTMSAT